MLAKCLVSEGRAVVFGGNEITDCRYPNCDCERIPQPTTTIHRFARGDAADAYVTLGWLPHPETFAGTFHGDHRALHVEWVCCCGRQPPEPEAGRDP